MVKIIRLVKEADRLTDATVAVQASPQPSQGSERQARDSASRVLKYLDDYRSPNDIRALREEGYEIDYDRLVGVGSCSAVFLAHSVNSPPPPNANKNERKPLYTPGYDIAAKVVAKKWTNPRRPSKIRTGNLKLALALGQTKADNNILRVIDIFKTPERVFIFMQYCAYGNVISFIRRNGQVPSRLAQRWMGQMAGALSFLHKFHVAHRNFKLENVLIDENLNAKLTGFGLSKFCLDLQTKKPIMSKTICGSEPYLAPEMLREAPKRLYDPKKADIWAFGVGLFLCITRKYPFEATDLRALKLEQTARKFFERDMQNRIQLPTRQLLTQLFTIDPNQRLNLRELIAKNVWLKSYASSKPVINQGQGQPQTQSPAGVSSPNNLGSSSLGPARRQLKRTQHRPDTDQSGSQKTQAHPQSVISQSETNGEHSTERDLSPVTPVTYQPKDVLPSAGSGVRNSRKIS